MAKFKSADIEIGKHYITEDIGKLAPIPTQPHQQKTAGAPRPQSFEGQEILSAFTEALLGSKDGHGLGTFLVEADGAVHNGYYDQLDLHLNELLYSIVDEVEGAVSRHFSQSLNFSAVDLEWVSDGKLNDVLTSQAAIGLPSLLDADAFGNLISAIRDRLPLFVGDALRWHVDTSELTKFLSAEIERFSVQEILPQIARNICNAEVIMSELSRTANVDTVAGGRSHG